MVLPFKTIMNGGILIRHVLYICLGLTHEEILGQTFILMAAGFETTSQTLTFLMYNLALYPECQEKVRQEVLKIGKDQVRGCDVILFLQQALGGIVPKEVFLLRIQSLCVIFLSHVSAGT